MKALLTQRGPVLILALGFLGCGILPGDGPAGSALTDEEMEYQRQLAFSEQAPNTDRGRAELVMRLDQNLLHWNRGNVEQFGSEDRKLVDNLEEVLQRTVYLNFETVLRVLETGEPNQKAIAAAAIGFARLREPADPEERRLFLARWPQLYPRAVSTLVRLLDAEEPYLVQNCLLGLWKLGDPTTPTDPIIALLTRPEEDIRANAVLALSTILTPETGEPAISALINALYDQKPKVRAHAVTAVAAIRNQSAAGRLAQLLDDRYLLVQANAAQALGKLGDVKNCEYLLKRLERLLRDTPDGEFRELTDLDRRRDFVATHLIASLELLSGQRHGDDIEKWRNWWLEERPR
ncbi:MAG: HEAT repeat domain-containing protein [Planctomycetota bacterium]